MKIDVKLGLVLVVASQVLLLGWCGTHKYLNFLKPEQKYTSGIMTLTKWQHIVDSDPKIGSNLPSTTLIDSNGASLPTASTNKPMAFLFVSSCATCIANKMTLWDAVQRAHPNSECLVVPMDADIPKVRKFQQENNVFCRVITDGKTSLTTSCNPYFKPRVYLFDGYHKLQYIQSANVSTEVAIAEVGHLLNTHSVGTQQKVAEK